MFGRRKRSAATMAPGTHAAGTAWSAYAESEDGTESGPDERPYVDRIYDQTVVDGIVSAQAAFNRANLMGPF